MPFRRVRRLGALQDFVCSTGFTELRPPHGYSMVYPNIRSLDLPTFCEREPLDDGCFCSMSMFLVEDDGRGRMGHGKPPC